jgi:L,D-transpeptidase ErfK/SrfK
MRTLLVLAFMAVASSHDMPQAVTGGVRTYEVAVGETASSIGARFGVDAATLLRDNGLHPNVVIRAGDHLRVDNRHIAPLAVADGVVLNVPQRMLFVLAGGVPLAAYPVAVGRSDWQTPLGSYAIASKETDPVWDVPVSIQEEMTRQHKPVMTKVAPGPDNPLGTHWMGLTLPAVGIHGTNQPRSIFRFTTHGCVRVHPEDMRELFAMVDVGTAVEIVYEPVLLGADQAGTVFLEVHRDPYKKGGGSASEEAVAGQLRRAGLAHLIGSPLLRRILAEKAGRAIAIAPVTPVRWHRFGCDVNRLTADFSPSPRKIRLPGRANPRH